MTIKTKKYLNRLEKIFESKQMLNKDDIAEYLDVSISSVSNLMMNENLSYIKLGNGKKSSVRVYVEDFAEYLSSVDVKDER